MVSAEQLYADGVSKRAIEHRLRIGRMHPEFRGVYSVGCGALPPLAREQGALLACGERAFLSHETAAAIWGVLPALPAEVEVTVVGRYRASSEGIKVHRINQIDRREVRREQGLWVSSPARALLEIAAGRSLGDLARALDEGLARRVLVRGEVEAVLERNRPCRGSGRLAELLAGGGGTTITRSEAERRFKRLIRDAGLPSPEGNVPFGRYSLDFLWREEGLVVEIDGYTFHGGPDAFRRDHDKDLAVRAAGLGLLRFTRDHVVHRREFVLGWVAGELARRRSAA